MSSQPLKLVMKVIFLKRNKLGFKLKKVLRVGVGWGGLFVIFIIVVLLLEYRLVICITMYFLCC